MTALVMATLLAAPLGERQLEAAIEEAQQRSAIADRIEQISRLFLGTSYGQYPLGEGSGVEPQPRWRADMVDCRTYVETVLAMANARNLMEAKALLDDIRYRARPISFFSCNHFTEAQWLPANEAKGYLTEETSAIDRDAPSATLVLRREQWSKVKGLERLAPAEIPEGDFTIRYLPLAEARRRAAQIAAGSVMLIVRAPDPQRVVRVSQMALVVRGAKGLVVRHAYCSWPVIGVALLRAVDARGRADAVARTGR